MKERKKSTRGDRIRSGLFSSRGASTFRGPSRYALIFFTCLLESLSSPICCNGAKKTRSSQSTFPCFSENFMVSNS